MTVESFEGAFPVGPTFAPDFLVRPEASMGSPVGVLARKYYAEGIDGLRSIDIDKLRPGEADLDESLRYMINLSAVHLGSTVLAIEEMIRDHEFDHPAYIEAIRTNTIWRNRATVDSPVAPEIEALSDADVDRIIMVARKDKTFSTFFGNGLVVLPRSLQRQINSDSIINNIRTLVLPGYTQRARLLIEHRARLRAQQAQASVVTF